MALLSAQGQTYSFVGGVLLLLALVWYVVFETRWIYRHVQQGWWRAFGLASGYLVLALPLVGLIAAVLAIK